jgi:prepilin-type N-terminal cleavage/methylation domain-containing protein
MTRRAYTLLELLVVIVILAILASLVVYGIHASLKESKQFKTEGLLHGIGGALGSYRTAFGDLPPSSLDRLGARLPNDTNNGIESLVACLSTTRKGGPFFQPLEPVYVNTDRDSVDRNLTGWLFGHNELMEYRDAFGTVLWYLHHADYGRPAQHHLRVLPAHGGRPVEVHVRMSAKHWSPVNPGGFQLVSAGPDGVFGIEDDLPVR